MIGWVKTWFCFLTWYERTDIHPVISDQSFSERCSEEGAVFKQNLRVTYVVQRPKDKMLIGPLIKPIVWGHLRFNN